MLLYELRVLGNKGFLEKVVEFRDDFFGGVYKTFLGSLKGNDIREYGFIWHVAITKRHRNAAKPFKNIFVK
jgi:hypothetical protein